MQYISYLLLFFSFVTRSESKLVGSNLKSLDMELSDEELDQKEMAAEIIGGIGEKLIDTICHDAITGHDVCSMLALSCLDIISELRAISTLSDIVATRGYLKHLLGSLARLDDQLRDLLKPLPDSLRPLYVYESCMAFLTQMAQSYLGATQLLNANVLGVLSNMTIYDMQPDLKASELIRDNPEDFLPDIDERYRSILLPALALCDSIIYSLGTQNSSASLQVLNFLFSHIDMIESMLRAATPFMELGHLKQLAAITNLFARTTTYDAVAAAATMKGCPADSDDECDRDIELSNRLSRLQQMMIVVYGRFTVNEATIRRMLHQEQRNTEQNISDEFSQQEQSEHVKYFLDIAANLSLYCRNAVTGHVRDGITSRYLLTTMVNDVTPL